MHLDNKEINFYQNNGVLHLKNLISEKWIKILKEGIKINFENPSKYKCVYEKLNDKELFYDDYCNWKRINQYKQFFFNSNIALIASQLMKSKKDSKIFLDY